MKEVNDNDQLSIRADIEYIIWQMKWSNKQKQKPFIDMSLKAQELELNGIERASSGRSTVSLLFILFFGSWLKQ